MMLNLPDHLDDVKRTREMKLEEARKNGELHECGCCFDDECLFEEMQACADGHIFCKECIRRSCEAAVGQGQTKFQCLTGKLMLMVISCVRSVSEGPVRLQ